MPSPTSLSAIRAEALAKRDRGDLVGARTMLEQALEAATMTSGEDHPEVLRTGHLLAGLHRQAGDLPGARRVLENAIYAGSNKHGEDFPPLLAMSYDLAEIADELGNRHEARRHYTRVARYGPAAGFDEQRVRAAQAWLGPAAPPSSVPALGQPVTLPGPTPLATPPLQAATPPVQTRPATPAVAPNPITKPAPTNSAPVSPAPVVASPVSPAPDNVPAIRQRPSPPAPPRRLTAPAQPSTPAPPYRQDVVPQPSSVPPASPAPARGRFAVIAASAAAVVAVLAAIITLVLVLLPNTDDPGPGGTLPPQELLAPTDVELTDNGGVLELRWTDHSKGLAAQVIIGNRMGEADKTFGQPGNGDARFELHGLNATWDYCFRIVSVYGQAQVRKSEQVCTNRAAAPTATP